MFILLPSRSLAGVPERAFGYLNPRETMEEVWTNDVENIARFLAGSGTPSQLAYIMLLAAG